MHCFTPISPLDCFFDPEKDKNKEYIVFNRFDFDYYKQKDYKVTLEQVTLEQIFYLWEKSIKEKEHRIVHLKLGIHSYNIDLRELYFFNSTHQGYKIIFEFAVENKTNQKVVFNPLFKLNNSPLSLISFKTTFKKIKKILIEFKELLFYNSLLIEDHNALFRKKNSHKLFKNQLFNQRHKRKINKITNDLWLVNADYFNASNAQFYKGQLQTLVSSLLYLHHKKYKEIHLANFTAPYQQAAIIYAKTNCINYVVVQHGRWMVHHLPSPLHKEFCKPETFIMWEKEFLSQINAELTHLKERPKSRLSIAHPEVVDDYVLIATSTPIIIDIDVYYQFWLILSEIQKQSNKVFKIKLHKKDFITPKITEFFKINNIVFIDKIDTVPPKAIVVNSTIYYELKEFTNVIDYKLSTTKEQLLDFINFQK